MIQIIGVMIGFYIIQRMLESLDCTETPVKVFATFTLAVAAIGMLLLFMPNKTVPTF